MVGSTYRSLSERLKQERATFVILGIYGLLVIVMTWPLASQLTSHIPGEYTREDIWTHQWTFWWIKQAVSEGHNPLYTNLIFYPEGISLTSHNIAWLNILFWLPLQAFVGQIAGYNLVFIGTHWLNALAAYFLMREMSRSLLAAFTAGIVFGFWPYTLSHYDHPNLILIAWVPLALLFLHRTMLYQRRRQMLLAVLFIVLIGITRWQLLIPSAVVFGIYVLWQLVTVPSIRNRLTYLRLGQIVLFSFILLAIIATPIIVDRLTLGNIDSLIIEHLTDGQTDLMAYLLPSPYHPVWGELIRSTELHNSFTYNRLYIPFIGFTTMIVASVGLLVYRRRVAVWGLMATVLIILSLGPVLRIAGELYPSVPMPYRLIEEFFFFRLLRRPDRFNILLGLPVSILVGFGITAIRQRFTNRYLAVSVTAVILALILFEATMLPFPTVRIDRPLPWYEQLAQDPNDFAIVEVPLDRVSYKRAMYWQTFHGKPTMQGRISRVPWDAYDSIDSIPILEYMRNKQTVDFQQGDVSRQFDRLDEMNIRYLVLHKHELPADEIPKWRDWFVVEPTFEDEYLAVYYTDLRYGRDFSFEQPLVDEMGIIVASLDAAHVDTGGLLPVTVTWGTDGAPSSDHEVCLYFSLESGAGLEIDPDAHPAAYCVSPAADWPTSEWDNSNVYRSQYRLPVPKDLASGSYQVELQLTDSDTGQLTGQPIILGTVVVDE